MKQYTDKIINYNFASIYFDPIAIKDLHINHFRINYRLHREIIVIN